MKFINGDLKFIKYSERFLKHVMFDAISCIVLKMIYQFLDQVVA